MLVVTGDKRQEIYNELAKKGYTLCAAKKDGENGAIVLAQRLSDGEYVTWYYNNGFCWGNYYRETSFSVAVKDFLGRGE